MENRPVDLSTKSFEEIKNDFKICKNNEIISKRVKAMENSSLTLVVWMVRKTVGYRFHINSKWTL